jgi:hypothetical protein
MPSRRTHDESNLMNTKAASLCLFLLALVGLAACAGGENSSTPLPAVKLPLAADRPTFLFFYTDN